MSAENISISGKANLTNLIFDSSSSSIIDSQANNVIIQEVLVEKEPEIIDYKDISFDIPGFPSDISSVVSVNNDSNAKLVDSGDITKDLTSSILYDLRKKMSDDEFKKIKSISLNIETDENREVDKLPVLLNTYIPPFPTRRPIEDDQISNYTYVDYLPEVWESSTPEAERTSLVIRVTYPVAFNDGAKILANRGYKRLGIIADIRAPALPPYNIAKKLDNNRKFPLIITTTPGASKFVRPGDPGYEEHLASFAVAPGPQRILDVMEEPYADGIFVGISSFQGDINPFYLKKAIKFIRENIPGIDYTKIMLTGVSGGQGNILRYIELYPKKADNLITHAFGSGSGAGIQSFTFSGLLITDVKVWIMNPVSDSNFSVTDNQFEVDREDRFMLPYTSAVNPNVFHTLVDIIDFQKFALEIYSKSNSMKSLSALFQGLGGHTYIAVQTWEKDQDFFETTIPTLKTNILKGKGSGKIERATIRNGGNNLFQVGDILEIGNQYTFAIDLGINILEPYAEKASFTINKEHINENGSLIALPSIDKWNNRGKGFSLDPDTYNVQQELVFFWIVFKKSTYNIKRGSEIIILNPITFGLSLYGEPHLIEPLFKPEFNMPYSNVFKWFLGETDPQKPQPTILWKLKGINEITEKYGESVIINNKIVVGSEVTDAQLKSLDENIKNVSRHLLVIEEYAELLNCITNESILNIISTDEGNKYAFNNSDIYKTGYNIGIGNYVFKNISDKHPMAILIAPEFISYKGDSTKMYKKIVNNIEYEFYYGNIEVEVKKDFNSASVYCFNHGYMGGENILKFNNSCNL